MTPYSDAVIDLFAGPGGWSVAAKALGMDEIGYEWGDDDCATARAAGHRRIQVDIATVDLSQVDYTVDGLIASPPAHFGVIPLLWVSRLCPRWVVLEQDVSGLGVWEAWAGVLRPQGYSVVVGVLHAQDFGVQAASDHAILAARRDGKEATLPRPMSRATSPHRDRLLTPAEAGRLLTPAEAGVLRSFPPDYPWQGSLSSQYQQVGDAVPPFLAYHILKEISS